jgi:hypothetical protein
MDRVSQSVNKKQSEIGRAQLTHSKKTEEHDKCLKKGCQAKMRTWVHVKPRWTWREKAIESGRAWREVKGMEKREREKNGIWIIRTLSERRKRGDRSWFRETASEKESKFDGCLVVQVPEHRWILTYPHLVQIQSGCLFRVSPLIVWLAKWTFATNPWT